MRQFIEVIKPKQTALLMITCVVAYLVSLRSLSIDIVHFLKAMISTFLAVAGTTALNMWLDRDIDALMCRTRNRPVPSGKLSPKTCMIYGSTLFISGFLIGLTVNVVLAIVLLLGLIFDIVIYTILLKRKSPYSIVLGGFAGAMPALAGWCAVREVDILGGLLLATIVLLWIPAHIWYITMHYEDDYRKANIPMYPLVVGMEKASWAIVFCTALMLIVVALLYIVADLSLLYLVLSTLVVSYFLYKAVRFAKAPDRVKARKMYKLASVTLGIVYISMLFGIFG
ncbi:heme o synthase [Archaeoglobus profundus]|uniref:Protoheme IX farnesyltransferase n=1 Tax=Archaeoglobus profundus (strain DSM 5631 / JCM 9629 / NBRC 100127 / Av18) TaxID=572546 RepID=D2RI71_ARCPA|nr:heme o synthase [Archaeoglobus profundus]ADB57996.1 protoheme IX farnesyltransferase [Archaeoglobus profundus DSM 5631]